MIVILDHGSEIPRSILMVFPKLDVAAKISARAEAVSAGNLSVFQGVRRAVLGNIVPNGF